MFPAILHVGKTRRKNPAEIVCALTSRVLFLQYTVQSIGIHSHIGNVNIGQIHRQSYSKQALVPLSRHEREWQIRACKRLASTPPHGPGPTGPESWLPWSERSCGVGKRGFMWLPCCMLPGRGGGGLGGLPPPPLGGAHIDGNGRTCSQRSGPTAQWRLGILPLWLQNAFASFSKLFGFFYLSSLK